MPVYSGPPLPTGAGGSVQPKPVAVKPAFIPATLTPLEENITRLVTEGLKNSQLAAALETSEQVIKNYLVLIYDKTGMGNRLELALWYLARHPEMAE